MTEPPQWIKDAALEFVNSIFPGNNQTLAAHLARLMELHRQIEEQAEEVPF